MSSIVGMTVIVEGADRYTRINYINGLIKESKKQYSSVLVDALEVEKNSVGIGEIRDLIEKSNYTSLSAKHRFFIIRDASKLTDQAQNALLKLYEEGRPDSTYILELDSHQSLLPTILSRAVIYDVSPGGEDTRLAALIAAHSFPKNVDFRSLKLLELFKLCEEYGKDRKIAENFTEYLSLLVRDSLRSSNTARQKQYLLYSEFLLQANEWLRETNVNARLLLENCILGWWNCSN